MQETIQIKGARVNNLKNINLTLPLNKFIVITGVSGSGKSSLAFNTLYAEGQRRYVESLSAYARQFLGRMYKPDCDAIYGLPPAIAIEQKVTARNPRSTVGTSTEIYDYLRMLFARIGHTYSPISGREVKKDHVDDIISTICNYSQGTRFTLLAPLFLPKERTLHEALSLYLQQGITRIDAEGEIIQIEDITTNTDESHLKSLEEKLHSGHLFLLIDRLAVSEEKSFYHRLADSIETALFEGHGECLIRTFPAKTIHHFSTRFEADGMEFEEPTDRMFSFNSPAGACEECEGFGMVMGIDEHLVIPDTSLSIMDDAIICWRGEKLGEWKKKFIRHYSPKGFPIYKPYFQLTDEERYIIWNGAREEQNIPLKKRICLNSFFEHVKAQQYKIQFRVMLSRYRGRTVCPKCHGTRLRPEANYVRIGGRSITQLVQLPIWRLRDFFNQLELTEHDKEIGRRLLTEIRSRIDFLIKVGLGYLTLDRLSNSLSGGESQRINLAKSLGGGLVGAMYILDEPSIGLHSRDTDKLIEVLKELRDIDNTVIVVEHDEDIMRAADYIVDIGPDAGRLGGEVVYAGENIFRPHDKELLKRAEALAKKSKSHTLDFLLHNDRFPIPTTRRRSNAAITINGGRENNLKNIDVSFPLNVLTAVTGVSGSGKSTLVHKLLYNALCQHFETKGDTPGEMTKLSGDLKMLSAVEFINQNPIGKSSRSNPVTYLKAYDEIRNLMAEQPLSKQLSLSPSHFSFNIDGGRCEECKGEGTIKVEMQFMADLVLTCESCKGKRFKKDILDVRFHELNIDDILNLTVDKAIHFFNSHKCNDIVKKLMPLQDVGLGYIKLGQSSSTLSGGENQRVKLAYFLSQEHVSPTLFIFDEPTTGLHFADIRKLLAAFNSLIERGHTVITIEHNLDIVKMADYVIDLGPEGGDEGGNIVAEGTPEEIVEANKGYTAKYLAEKLKENVSTKI